jgi:galactokinase/mevalonate kinase-like predicted kinase
LNSQDIAAATGGYNYLQWASNSRRWIAEKKLSRGTDQVEKLTDGCLGAFHAISRRLDVLETTANTIDQRTQRVEARLQRVEDGIDAILNMLQARPPVNNQVAVAAAIDEEAKEDGKSFCC